MRGLFTILFLVLLAALLFFTGGRSFYEDRWPTFYDRCLLSAWRAPKTDSAYIDPLRVGYLLIQVPMTQHKYKDGRVIFEPYEVFCATLDARRRTR